MEFKHFSHIHGLTFYHMPEGSDPETLCSGCKLGGLTAVYMCWQCQYFLHQSCFEAKRSLTHPSHPPHPLSLLPCPTYPSGSFLCNSCHHSGTGFSYACSDCDFDIHVHCAHATSDPSHSTAYAHNPINYSNPQFAYPPPPAPEVSGANPPVFDHYPPQSYHAENFPVVEAYPPVFNGHVPPATSYSMDPAANPVPAYFNQSPLPNPTMTSSPIENPPPVFNGHIPPATSYSMDPAANPVQVNPIPAYFNQNPQPNPTISSPIENQPAPSTESTTTQVAKHFSHQHALRQSKIEEEDGLLCSGCEHAISEGTAYACTKSKFCNFRLHKSCFDLPKEMNHRSHPAHPLILLSAPPYKNSYIPEFTCNACFKTGNSFVYHCSSCNFDLHVACASLPDSVKRVDHEHPLRLILSSPYEQSKAGEDEVVFMCDVCERTVDSNCWVYYCKECDFGTDVGCVNCEIEEGEGGKDEDDDGLTPAERMLKMQNEFQLMQFQMQMNQQLAQSIAGMGQSIANLV